MKNITANNVADAQKLKQLRIFSSYDERIWKQILDNCVVDLSAIHFSNSSADGFVNHLISLQPHDIQSLHFLGKCVSTPNLTRLIRSCPKLKNISASITIEIATSLSESCHMLRSLSTDYLGRSDIAHKLAHISSLKELTVYKITNKSLQWWSSSSSTKLTSLSIQLCGNDVTETSICRVIEWQSDLEHLRIPCSLMTDTVIDKLAKCCSNLTTLGVINDENIACKVAERGGTSLCVVKCKFDSIQDSNLTTCVDENGDLDVIRYRQKIPPRFSIVSLITSNVTNYLFSWLTRMPIRLLLQ
jgi:hypothetical protein